MFRSFFIVSLSSCGFWYINGTFFVSTGEVKYIVRFPFSLCYVLIIWLVWNKWCVYLCDGDTKEYIMVGLGNSLKHSNKKRKDSLETWVVFS